ncbi:hypothetical protein TNIN_362571 [Trichonephila inaurata madagascariensis]|uniref:Uncharacterized protein n=1 Tax=Trichonephila inaurata madagascariensis TaxID=2747483 RepID=A0A8X6XQL9_9ARAC|nr:hypothetical protein TNIN_362571 [Trichonephila inaurata madagascariensis]
MKKSSHHLPEKSGHPDGNPDNKGGPTAGVESEEKKDPNSPGKVDNSLQTVQTTKGDQKLGENQRNERYSHHLPGQSGHSRQQSRQQGHQQLE